MPSLRLELLNQNVLLVQLQLLLDDLVEDSIELDQALPPLHFYLEVKLLLHRLEEFHFYLFSDLLDIDL